VTMGQRQQLLFWLGALACLLLLIYLLSPILLPFVAGSAIAYFLDPAVDRLERWRVPRSIATILALLLFVFAVMLVLALLVPLLQLQASSSWRRRSSSLRPRTWRRSGTCSARPWPTPRAGWRD
jgi:predicted PurR-regulated permease PerM